MYVLIAVNTNKTQFNSMTVSIASKMQVLAETIMVMVACNCTTQQKD